MTSMPVAAAFPALPERHHEAVFRAALRVTGSLPADAEGMARAEPD